MTGLILADAGGKHDSIHAVENCHISADKFLDFIFQHFLGKLCPGISPVRRGAHIPVVAGNTGNPQQTGFLIQESVHILWGHSFFFGNISDNRRIQSSGTGSHHKAIQRGQSHTGIHTFSTVNSGNGRTIAQMAGDNLQVFDVSAHHLRALLADITVRSAVKAIAADFIFFIILIRNREHISLWRHGRMESGIKNNHLWYLGAEHLTAGADSLNMSMVVQGR